MLIIGRAVAGIGSAGLVSGGLTITASAVPIEKRAPLTAILMGISQLGVAFGPILGGVFTSYATWRWCFYINLPIGGLLGLGICLVPVPNQIQKPTPWSVIQKLHSHFDIFGFILIAGASFQILLALSWGGSKYEWDSGFVTGLFSGAAGIIIVWLVWNWHQGDAALIPISLIKTQAVWTGALTHCFLLTNVFCASFFLPIYFQAVRGVDPMMSAVYVLPSILLQLFSVSITGFAGKLPSVPDHISTRARSLTVTQCK